MTLVFDIDNTILLCDYIDGVYYLKAYDPDIISIMNLEYEKGTQIVIQTARHWNHFNITKEQLEKVGAKFHTLLMGKPVADLYIDDRGISPEKFCKIFNKQYGGKRWQTI